MQRLAQQIFQVIKTCFSGSGERCNGNSNSIGGGSDYIRSGGNNFP